MRRAPWGKAAFPPRTPTRQIYSARSVRSCWETGGVIPDSRGDDRPVGIFAAPNWMRDLGAMAWLLVGITLLTIGVIALLGLTQTIVMPVITAAIIAAVLSPLVRRLV